MSWPQRDTSRDWKSSSMTRTEWTWTTKLSSSRRSRGRAAALATTNVNLAKAAENWWKEWQQQEEDNRTDILNQLQGELLSKSQEQGISVLGLPRLRHDSCKGITNEQLQHIIDYHQQQIEKRAEKQQEELHQDWFCVASARTALLLERQQARINKQLRRTLGNTNTQLAEAHHEQKKYLYNVFSQFNTSSR